jgi:O-methyltransferase
VKRHDRAFNFFQGLFKKYQSLTMIAEELFIMNLDLCNHYKHLEGDYVECGVWRGGMSAAISEILNENKTVHLFDSFEGLPKAEEIDGKEALEWQKDIYSASYFNNCSAEENYARQAMVLAKRENYRIYKGWFDQTLPDFKNQKIGILRLDGDWYSSVFVCLENLFPQVLNGGIIVLDDYHTWDGCSKAVHDYLSKIKSPSRVYQWNNQIAYIIKKS